MMMKERDTPEENNTESNAEAMNKMMKFFGSKKICSKSIKLPEKVMYILEGCGNTYSEILSWSSDGKYIVVSNTKAFEELITPRYFKPCTFDSFCRKMRRWGFSTRRLRRGGKQGKQSDRDGAPEKWAFQHPAFTKETGFEGCHKIVTSSPAAPSSISNPAQQMMNTSANTPLMMSNPPPLPSSAGLLGPNESTLLTLQVLRLRQQQQRELNALQYQTSFNANQQIYSNTSSSEQQLMTQPPAGLISSDHRLRQGQMLESLLAQKGQPLKSSRFDMGSLNGCFSQSSFIPPTSSSSNNTQFGVSSNNTDREVLEFRSADNRMRSILDDRLQQLKQQQTMNDLLLIQQQRQRMLNGLSLADDARQHQIGLDNLRRESPSNFNLTSTRLLDQRANVNQDTTNGMMGMSQIGTSNLFRSYDSQHNSNN